MAFRAWGFGGFGGLRVWGVQGLGFRGIRIGTFRVRRCWDGPYIGAQATVAVSQGSLVKHAPSTKFASRS